MAVLPALRRSAKEMKARVICSKCRKPLTDWLLSVDQGFEVEWKDCENIIPKGHYWVADEEFPQSGGKVHTHLDDQIGLVNDEDSAKWTGCCGPSAGVPNQLCECGSEVATEVADCWTSYFRHFEPDATELEKCPETAP